MKWVDKHIEVTPAKKPLKVTGTRFATILGLNDWNTPFGAFCEINKVYREPFEDTIYTIAGKLIEPKQIEYLKKSYYMNGIKTPEDVWGKDYFKKTWGDFYKDEPIFGGMWDALDEDETLTVIECKSTKRSEDWNNGNIPIYYAMQAALYAYLKGTDNVLMVATFLEDRDYAIVDKYMKTKDESLLDELVVDVNNTIVKPFKIYDLFPDFDDLIRQGVEFWENHVKTGISPDYDEKKDAAILKELRKNTLNPTTDIEELLVEYETLDSRIKEVKETIAAEEERLAVVNDLIKEYLSTQFRDGDKQVAVKGDKIEFILSQSTSKSIDKERIIADGLLDRYETTKVVTRFTKKENKED